MLSECVTLAYLKLLEGLAAEIGPKSYRYWPPGVGDSEKISSVSTICCNSFWQEVLQTRYKLYVADDSSSIKGFRPLASEEAIFDTLDDGDSRPIRKVLMGHNLSG